MQKFILSAVVTCGDCVTNCVSCRAWHWGLEMLRNDGRQPGDWEQLTTALRGRGR